MKIKINKVVQPEIRQEQEVEITLPRFSKEGDWCYMIVGEKTTLCVDTESCGIRLWDDYRDKAREAIEAPEITEEEFMLAYHTAKSLIEVEVNKVLQTV